MQGRRYAAFYTVIPLTGAFGGLIATGINKMNGLRGIVGWRWIFIIEWAIPWLPHGMQH